MTAQERKRGYDELHPLAPPRSRLTAVLLGGHLGPSVRGTGALGRSSARPGGILDITGTVMSLSLWPWLKHLTFLNLSVCICRMEARYLPCLLLSSLPAFLGKRKQPGLGPERTAVAEWLALASQFSGLLPRPRMGQLWAPVGAGGGE